VADKRRFNEANMLSEPTVEKLCAMRLRGMAEAFREQQQSPDVQRLSFEERLGLLIDRQWNWRENRALERRLRDARLQGAACVEDIDFHAARSGAAHGAFTGGRIGLGTRTPEPVLDRPNWDRQDVAGASVRTEGLP
jgi:hypothetical protein